MQNVYVNKNEVPQSLTGSQEWQVDKLDFDTSCPCQITACDGGTIKVCAKMEIEDLVIDSLCIDGELGCDSLVIQNGITEGMKFADDPCDGASARRLAMYEDGASVTLLAQPGRTLNLETGPDDILITPGRDLKVNAVRDIVLTPGSGGVGSFVGTAGVYFNTVYSTSVMATYIGTTALPVTELYAQLIGDSSATGNTTNVFSRRINLMTTAGGVKIFPSPGGPELVLPASTSAITPSFPGDKEGDMLVGYRLAQSNGGLTLFLCREQTTYPYGLYWLRLGVNTSIPNAPFAIFGSY